jgi:nicotinamidase-related amidase
MAVRFESAIAQIFLQLWINSNMSKNKAKIRSAIARPVIFILSFTVLSSVFFYGIGVGVYHWPPFFALQEIKHILLPKKNEHQAKPLQNSLKTSPAVQDTRLKANEHQQKAPYNSADKIYTVKTTRRSYFALDADGQLKLKNSLPYRSERIYHFRRTIKSNRTAVVIMDPWVDMPTAHLNQYTRKVTESRILPLAKKALGLGHPILILTNDRKKSNHSAKIHQALQSLVDDGNAIILFHQDFDDDRFAAYLLARKIESLIYIGFSSNMCVIGRNMGMIPMKNQGFNIYFMPEASAAIEYAESWHDQSIHKVTTRIISQWIAEIIDYDEFMKAVSYDQNKEERMK